MNGPQHSPVDHRLHPVRLPGTECPVGVFACTHLEQRMVAMQRVDTLGALAAGIAHDFNNVLTGMLGAASGLADELGEGHPALGQVDLLRSAALRARSLVAHMLSFSRPGQEPMRWHSVQGLVQEALALLRPSLPPTVQLTVALAPAPLEAQADAAALIQVVLNLCLNALHALPDRTGRITVTLSAQPADVLSDTGPARLLLSVSDTGCGIEPALQERIFEPYFTTRAQSGGTGLGLATVQHVVQSHGGHVSLRSQPGHGSTFEVHLPGQVLQDPVTPDEPLGAHRPLQVLLVDDDEVLRAVVAAMLECDGHQVTALSSAAAALAHWRARPGEFDLVISDHWLVGASGLELARELLAVAPRTAFLLLTGHVTDPLVAEAEAAGVRRVLDKADLHGQLRPALSALA